MSRATLDTACFCSLSCTGISPSLSRISMRVPLARFLLSAVRTPLCTHSGLGSSAFARRYLRNHSYFLFLRLLRCFSSPGSPPHDYGFIMRCVGSSYAGFPIQISPAHSLCAAPRSFSQLTTSFFGSQCQGIRPAPFLA